MKIFSGFKCVNGVISLMTMTLLTATITNALASGIKITSTGGDSVNPQVQVLQWGDGEQGKVLGWVKAPDTIPVSSGDYGLRLVGTDYIFGPVRIAKDKILMLETARISITAPGDSDQTVFFLTDQKTGALSARIPVNSGVVPVLPGKFNLTRDLSNVTSSITIKAGQHMEIKAGAIAIAAPKTVQDCDLYIVDQQEKIAAFFRMSQGVQVVLPGSYRVIKKDTGAFSSEIKVVGGERTVLSCAGISASSLDQGRVPYLVLRQSDLAPMVSARCDGKLHLVFPGTYLIVTKQDAVESMNKEKKTRFQEATVFTARKADHVSLWHTRDNRFFTSHDSLIPVMVEAKQEWLAVGRDYRATVSVAEKSTVRLFIRDLETGKELGQVSEFEANPPMTGVSFTLPKEIIDGTTIVIEARASVASGASFKGSSSPRRAVHSRAGKVREFAVTEKTETTIALSWKEADGKDVVGFNVYRVPQGRRPINGKIPLTKAALVDIGLSANRKYNYLIRAVDPRGIEGPDSEIVSATTHQPQDN